MSAISQSNALRTIKLVHTAAWAFFALCILTIGPLAWLGKYGLALLLIGIVFIEVLVLVLNGWRCPLTSVAARHTNDRRDNFDIYLPESLARRNKLIFGALYLAAILFTLVRWTAAMR